MTLRENIRKALTSACNYDFLACHRVLMAERAWPVSRPAIVRLMKMALLLSEGTDFNSSDLAKLFNVSTKTIGRDIAMLRDQLCFPISFDAATHSFKKGTR